MYQFKVKWFDEKEIETCGLVVGNTFGEAMSRLMDYFGESTTEAVTLEWVGAMDGVITYCDGVTDLSSNFENL